VVRATAPTVTSLKSLDDTSGYQIIAGQLTGGDRMGIAGQASGTGTALVFFDNAQTTFRPSIFDASSHAFKIGGVATTSITSTGFQGAIGATTASTGRFTTVTATSTISGSNLSGTNTGDQTISITGDVTAAGSTGALSATVTKINGTALSGLATGILKNTTTTGVPSIAVAADFPTLNQSTTGSAATLTTPRAIYGNNFDGSAALTQVIASTYGGTGNGFTKFSGPTTAERTFTLPNASSTLLYEGGTIGVTTPAAGNFTSIGVTTQGTGAFTTLSASGLLSANAGLSVTGTTQGSGLFKIGTGTFTTAVNTTGVQFDTSTTNSGIEWVASPSGSGYGHRIIDIDSGAGYAAWKLQGRTNSGTFSTVLQVDGNTGLAVTGALSSTTGANFATSSGSVGVGTASPRIRLEAVGTDSAESGTSTPNGGIMVSNPTASNSQVMTMGVVNGASNHSWIQSRNSTSANFYSLVLNPSGGNVGIGTTSPNTKLHILTDGTYDPLRLESTQSGFARNWAIGPNVGVNGLFVIRDSTAGANRVAIDTSGNLLVGTTSALPMDTARISADGSGTGLPAAVFRGASGDGVWAIKVGTVDTSSTRSMIGFCNNTGATLGGITTNGTIVIYGGTSDYRLKDITGPLTDSGSFIDALKPKVGTWKSDGSKFVGFLAHEFAEVSPSSVTGEKDAVDAEGNPKYQGMQASSAEVIANLVAELQSVRQRLAALESK
jgi:hypothetical protein